MTGPWIGFFPVLLEDDLANFLSVEKFIDSVAAVGIQSIKIEDGQKVFALEKDSIVGPISKSLELINTGVAYQTVKAAKVILVITEVVTKITDFEVIEDASADAGTGTTKEDFPTTNIDNRVTTQVLDFAASKFITVKMTVGRGNVEGYVIE